MRLPEEMTSERMRDDTRDDRILIAIEHSFLSMDSLRIVQHRERDSRSVRLVDVFPGAREFTYR